MNELPSISAQLNERRSALGLSLSDLARRTGTSPATLSRYESGWTRFETYTLRKLASALDCELHIALKPKPAPSPRKPSAREIQTQLKRLFWDRPLRVSDLRNHTTWVVERVLDYGNLDDVHALMNNMGRKPFLRVVAEARRVSPRTRAFWCQLLEMEGVPCTKKYSRNTRWIS